MTDLTFIESISEYVVIGWKSMLSAWIEVRILSFCGKVIL